MQMSTSAPRELAGQGARAHVEDLLRRYPDVSAPEAAEILAFLKNGPVLEVALMTTDDQLRERLDRFRTDKAADFGLSLKDYLIVASLVSIVILAAVLLWDMGVK